MTNTDIAIGTKVQVQVDNKLTIATYDGFSEKYNSPVVVLPCGRRMIRRVLSVVGQTTTTETTEEIDVPAVPASRKFGINERFDFLSRFVRMIATGTSTSLVVAGEGGLGKSYTVKQALADAGLRQDHDFIIVKGFSTPKALYRTLFENVDKVIVFDDCDSVLRDATAINVLKATLDSEPVRVVSWLSEQRGEDALPNSFEFTGKVIFITNLTIEKVPQAVTSRGQRVDVSMTQDEKIARMYGIVDHIKPEIARDVKVEVIEFLNQFRNTAKDLNMRTLLKVSEIRVANPTEWRDMAEYSISI
jgi:hypothetical protein